MSAPDLLSLALMDALWSALAALGFAVLFNVPVRTLPGCVACGALGHVLRTLLATQGLSLELASLVGATAVGFVGSAFARRWETPTMIFTVSGVIPMVPGVFAFRAMLGVIALISAPDAQAGLVALYETAVNAARTGLILAALAVGIAAPTLLFYRRRPSV